MNTKEKAARYFDNGFNCSQSVLASFAPALGLSEEESLRVASPFGGGMGRQQLTCGAVTGGLMALGLLYGKGLPDPESKKEETYRLTRSFCLAFRQQHGALSCRELLLDLDMNDPSDKRKIKELNLWETRCMVYVKSAVELVEAIRQQHEEESSDK